MSEGSPIHIEPQRRRISFSGEVMYVFALRRQAGANHVDYSDHPVLETPSELQLAERYAKRLKDLMFDDLLGPRLSIMLQQVADGFVAMGKITEEQYLSVFDAYLMAIKGNEYKPTETPIQFLMDYGSIHSDLNRTPIYNLKDVTHFSQG